MIKVIQGFRGEPNQVISLLKNIFGNNEILLEIERMFNVLNPIIDKRGYFVRTYDKTLFDENNLSTNWSNPYKSFLLTTISFT